MSVSSARQTSVALVLSMFIAGPALAMGNETPAPPPSSTKAPPASSQTGTKSGSATDSKSGMKKHNDKKSSVDDPAFLQGYRAAYATVYEQNDYAAAIPQLLALGQDNRADVANLIGYSYRKLGNYELARVWYERALKADPDHVRTWQYYGLWQVEQGNREQAKYHLARIESIAGKDSIEYRSLAAALATGQASY